MNIRTLAWLVLATPLLRPGGAGAQIIDHSNPSAGNDDLVANQNYNWGPIFLGGVCRLTDKGSSETASIWSRERVNVGQFQTSFVFQILSGGPGDTSNGEGNCADGLTFTIQNQGLDALGGEGGSLGCAGINHSVAVKFDTVPNDGDPSVSSTGLYANGEGPFGGTDLLKDGVALRSQHPFRVDMKYDGRVLAVRIADLTTGAFSTQEYKADIPKLIGSRVAYVGFTAATGLGTSAQDLHKWYFASPPLRIGASGKPVPSGLQSARRSAPAAPGVTVAAWPTTTRRGADAARTARVAQASRP